jgi:hypothetical protein
MRFYRDKFGMGGLVIGSAAVLLLLFLQNSGGITLENPILSSVWWLLAWPFTMAALIVASTATGSQMSPGWGMPLLLLSIALNIIYLYWLGRFVGFVNGRLRKSG